MSNHENSTKRHHSKEEVIQINKKRKNMRQAANTFFVLSFVVLLVYVVHRFMPFMKSISFYHRINVSSITYMILRIVMILMPFVFFFPSSVYKQFIHKTTLISYVYGLASFLFFFGMVADVFSYNLLGGYVDDGSDPILLKLFWNVTDKSGVFLCLGMGICYLLMSKKITGHKKTVVLIHIATFILYCIIPLIMTVLNGTIGTEDWYMWFGKNIYFFISNLLMLVAFFISASSRWVWGTVVWG